MAWVSWEKLTKPKFDGGLGFRDLRSFNTALLGKLAWRIIQQPECLLSRVLTGKYCHSSNFLNVKCVNSASHGWRSVLEGRDLLKTNLGWVVGDGKSIKIWDEAWISHSTQIQPMGPAPWDGKDLLVKDLFVQGSVDWDTEKIAVLLPAYETEILALKPSRLGALDKQVWLGHPSGVYSTKSGYHSAIKGSDLVLHQPAQAPINWKSEVWDIHTAPKVKVFLWKAIQGALPTGKQLQNRHLNVSSDCCRCGEPETIPHLLFNCRFAQNVWNTAPFASHFATEDMESATLGIAKANKQVCLPPMGLVAPLGPWICRNLWKARNQKIFNWKNFSVEETVAKTIKDAKEWQEAQCAKGKSSQVPSPWIRPPCPPLFRSATICQSDAAWNKDSKRAGLGWSFLDPLSETSLLQSAVCVEVTSPLMAESLACRAALSDTIRKGISHLIFESDCQSLVRAVNSHSFQLEIYGILSDIFICMGSFSSFLCRYIPRSENVVADNLAKQALSLYVANA